MSCWPWVCYSNSPSVFTAKQTCLADTKDAADRREKRSVRIYTTQPSIYLFDARQFTLPTTLTLRIGSRFCVRSAASTVWHERSYSTFSPVSTGMGDRLRAGITPRYLTKPTIGQLSLASLNSEIDTASGRRR